jgi:hypothetical protein
LFFSAKSINFLEKKNISYFFVAWWRYQHHWEKLETKAEVIHQKDRGPV